KLALNRRYQALEVSLHYIVLRTGPHCFDRHIFADGPRDKNEGGVRVFFPQHSEGGVSAEGGHVEIANDQVPAPAREGSRHSAGAVSSLAGDLKPRATNSPQQQDRVFLGVSRDQDSERDPHTPPN